jgi:hypothetical protein
MSVERKDMERKDRARKDMGDQELAEFERKLSFAMQHRPAPLGLKQRVLARARERRQAGRGRIWILQRLAASIVLATIIGGFAAYHQVEERAAERRRGEQAREQVMTALRITSRTLNRVNDRLAENSR